VACATTSPWLHDKLYESASGGLRLAEGRGHGAPISWPKKRILWRCLTSFPIPMVGLAALMLAKAMGADKLIGVDVVDERLEVAQRLGLADHVLKAGPKTSRRFEA
jgi:hypothetical protein